MAKDQVGSKRSHRQVVDVSGRVLVFFSKDIDLGTKVECRFNLSLSLNSKWPRPTNPTINNKVAHTNTTTNGGRSYHSPFLFCFLFYFSIYFNFICLFCFGYGRDFFFFGLLIRFGCKKLMNVCKFGLLSKWV